MALTEDRVVTSGQAGEDPWVPGFTLKYAQGRGIAVPDDPMSGTWLQNQVTRLTIPFEDGRVYSFSCDLEGGSSVQTPKKDHPPAVLLTWKGPRRVFRANEATFQAFMLANRLKEDEVWLVKVIDLFKKSAGQEDGKILLFGATASAVEKIRAKNCLLRLGSQNSPIFYNKRPPAPGMNRLAIGLLSPLQT